VNLAKYLRDARFGKVMIVHNRTLGLNASPKLRNVPRIMQITLAHLAGKPIIQVMARNRLNDKKRPLKKPAKHRHQLHLRILTEQRTAINISELLI
jgi:hypothetical protein